MNSVLPTIAPTTEAAVAVRTAVADAPGKRSRQQSALIALGKRGLSKLSAADLEQEILDLVSRALDASYCTLVEIVPESSPSIVESVHYASIACAGALMSGDALADDELLSAALEHSTPILVADLQTDGRYRQSGCYRQGIGSAMALPLELHGQQLGVLVVGQETPGGYTAEDLLFAEIVSSMLVAYVARAKAEEAVRREREFTGALLDSSSALTLTIEPDGTIARANQACLSLSGLGREQLVGQLFWQSLCVPTECRLTEVSFGQLNRDVSAIEFESNLLTADGDRRTISWRLCYFSDPRNNSPLVVATGIDMTSQRAAEREARQAIVSAEAAKQLVAELRSLQGTNSRLANADPASPKRTLTGAERRTSDRKLFPYRQQIAPLVGGVVPPREEFHAVRCWDISASGISFLFDQPPSFKSVVVVLGGNTGEILMAADIVRVTELRGEAEKGFLVGCQFTGKI